EKRIEHIIQFSIHQADHVADFIQHAGRLKAGHLLVHDIRRLPFHLLEAAGVLEHTFIHRFTILQIHRAADRGHPHYIPLGRKTQCKYSADGESCDKNPVIPLFPQEIIRLEHLGPPHMGTRLEKVFRRFGMPFVMRDVGSDTLFLKVSAELSHIRRIPCESMEQKHSFLSLFKEKWSWQLYLHSYTLLS